jgi:RUN and FYVE domain-containing protein 1
VFINRVTPATIHLFLFTYLSTLQGLLGPKKELWDLLQKVEKHDAEASDITASVRDLPTVRTAIGRARAWLRLALMQKKLADYFR